MENRGNPDATKQNERLAISRRSCDQCRARKIGCDRGSPCSNCLSARVDCTHSPVASRSTTPKQRILISANYERKIDDIARDVDGIKQLLQGLKIPTERPSQALSLTSSSRDEPRRIQAECETEGDRVNVSQWDHSAHIIDFIRSVADDNSSNDEDSSQSESESTRVKSSLKKLLATLEGSDLITKADFTSAPSQSNNIMPELESVLEILRWAKKNSTNTRVVWICKILPLDIYEQICCKVYFAVDSYTEAEFIITNSFLSYMFAEHAIVYGAEKSRRNCHLCRSNVGAALQCLPLLLPASMEAIAALTLGCLHSIEDSRAPKAWTLISAAMNLCQTLGYHRLGLRKSGGGHVQEAQESLFWAVFTFENGMSLRLGRSSGIRDSDIVMPVRSHEHRSTKVGRIQRKVYDQLYSPVGLSCSAETRGLVAENLADELQAIINETHTEISNATDNPRQMEVDPMKVLYLQCDLVCQSSLLVLILRAIPISYNPGASDSCLKVARDTFDMHDQCMKLVRGCEDHLLVRKYVNWAVLHTPFVPFSIIFTRVIEVFDTEDLGRLERFAHSFKDEHSSTEPITHPYRLYELLYKAAKLYFDANALTDISRVLENSPRPLTDQIDVQFEVENAGQGNEIPEYLMLDLGRWYYSNRQLMGLMDEDIRF